MDHKTSESLQKTMENQRFSMVFRAAQVKGNTIFDNIIITDSTAEADKFVEKWKALSAIEKAKKKEEEGRFMRL